jgi:serine protease Do
MLVPAIAGRSLSPTGLSGFFLCLVFLMNPTSAPAQQVSAKPVPPSAGPQKAAPGAGQAKASETRPSEAPPLLRELNSELQALVAKVSPAVVQVLVTGYGPASQNGRTDTALIVRQHAVGSGVILDPNGYIVTNAHVVEGAQRIRVALPMPMEASQSPFAPAGRRSILDAKLVGIHKESDLALLKIDETNLPTLALGTGRFAHEGQLVFAIGSPEGLQNSVTMGVVSAVARQADPAKPMVYIQTDAPINPGNSGGPLVDMEGEVVGINTFILSESGGSEGLGFAIPARVVRFVYESLRKYGHVHRTEIGAGTQAITPDLAEGLQLSQSWGVIISDVTPDGPAAAAGLKVQDIVLTADGRSIQTLPALSAALYLHRLDEVLKLGVLRGKEKLTLVIPAIEHRDHMDQLLDATDPEKSLVPRLGILAVDLTDQLHSMIGTLRIPSGVVVVGRSADLTVPDIGVQTGDIIHALNTTRIDSVDSLRAAVKPLKTNDPVVLQVEREGGLLYLTSEME